MLLAAASLFAPDMVASATAASSSFWNRPIDIILYDVLVGFGWIPIVVVLLWGFIMVWLVNRQGKWVGSLKYVLLAVDVPATTEQSPKALENMFSSLWGAYSNLTWKERWIIGKTQPLFSFEIASREGYIQYYVRVLTRYRDLVEAGIYAVYPEAEITEVEDYTAWAPTSFPHDTWDTWGSELILKKPDIFPIRTFEDFEDKLSGELKDPLAPILEQLAKMRPGEHFWVQFIIQPNGNDWKEQGKKFIDKIYGIEEKHKVGFFDGALKGAMSWPSDVMETATGVSLNALLYGASDAHGDESDPWKAFKLTLLDKQLMEGVIDKVSKVGYSFKLRLVYLGKKGVYDKQARTAFVKGMFTQYAHLNLNSFGLWGDATPKDDYFWQAWTYPARQGRLVGAFKRRSWGMGATPGILNAAELATLWHFPAIQVKAPLVKKSESRRAEPPVGLQIEYEEQSLAERSKARSYPGDSVPPPVMEAMAQGTPHIPSISMSDDVPMHLPVLEKPLAEHTSRPAVAFMNDEVELGLDATDMGPPADIILPGPPPGWKPEDEPGAPPNLPV